MVLKNSFYERFFRDIWPPMPAVLALGVLAGLYFGLVKAVWAVTGEFTRWGGHILQWLGYDPLQLSYFKIIKFKGTPLDRVDGWVVLGMFAGALGAALIGGNFKIRVPVQRRRLLQGFIGGVIAGFGTRLAMGCNLAAMFTGIPQFTLHAWLFTVATAIGTYFGLKVTLSPFFLGRPLVSRGGTVTLPEEKSSSLSGAVGWAVLLLAVGFCLYGLATGKSNLALAGLFGIAFGLVIERAQVCFTSAFRDLWLVGRSTMIRALVAGMAVQSLLTLYFISRGQPAKVMWAGPGAVLGGLLFGFGIVIAGGCETGWMYRAMEGQVNFWLVGAGNVVGATLLAVAWDKAGIYKYLVEPYPKVDFVKLLGPAGALLLTLVLLALLYGWAVWREKRVRSAGSSFSLKVAFQQEKGAVKEV